jgi:hypothetical protein
MPSGARVLLICPDRATAEDLAAVVRRHGAISATPSVRMAVERGAAADLIVVAGSIDASTFDAVAMLRHSDRMADVPFLAVSRVALTTWSG